MLTTEDIQCAVLATENTVLTTENIQRAVLTTENTYNVQHSLLKTQRAVLTTENTYNVHYSLLKTYHQKKYPKKPHTYNVQY